MNNIAENQMLPQEFMHKSCENKLNIVGKCSFLGTIGLRCCNQNFKERESREFHLCVVEVE